MPRDVRIAILGDSKDFQRAVAQANASAKSLNGSVKAAGDLGKKAAIPVGIGTAALGLFAKSAIDAGSSLNETVSKSNTVFGEQGRAMEQWANGASRSLGQSKQQALEASSSFGNMFKQLGIGGQDVAKMSQQMTALASDFASFHNADISEVLIAQQAAFRGEYDALQRFVPTINAAAVEQKALAMTGKKTTKELTLQEKAIATQALMMEGAGDAMGDFARTSDSFANQQRILGAQFEDLKAKIGQALIPVVMKLAEVLFAVGRFIADHKEPFIALAVVIGGALVAAFVSWAAAAASAATATLAAAAPVLLIGAAIAALVAGIIYAYKNWDWFRNAVDAVARFLTGTLWPILQRIARFFTDTLVPAVRTAINFVRDNWKLILGILTGPIGAAVAIITTHWTTIKNGVTAVKDWIVARLNDVMTFLAGLPGRVGRLASITWSRLKNGVGEAVRWILDQLDRILGPLDEIAGKVGSVVGKLGGAAGSIGGMLGFAQGGTVPGARGKPRLILAHGGEHITQASAVNRPGAGGGGNTYSISVTTLDAKSAGQAVVEAIETYERTNGRRFARAS